MANYKARTKKDRRQLAYLKGFRKGYRTGFAHACKEVLAEMERLQQERKASNGGAA